MEFFAWVGIFTVVGAFLWTAKCVFDFVCKVRSLEGDIKQVEDDVRMHVRLYHNGSSQCR